jgi:acyl-CoA thioester hydrolase
VRLRLGRRKAFRVEPQQPRHCDGDLVTEITNVGGLPDREKRRLVAEPRKHWRSVAKKLAGRVDLAAVRSTYR